MDKKKRKPISAKLKLTAVVITYLAIVRFPILLKNLFLKFLKNLTTST